MGDRCYLSLTFRKTDAKEVAEAFGFKNEKELFTFGSAEIDDLTPNVVTVGFDEVNYGGQNELEDLASKNVLFEGWHGTGGSYPEETFCSFRGLLRQWVRCDGQDIMFISPEEPRGSEEAAQEYVEYCRIAREVHSMLCPPVERNALPEDT